MERTPLTEEQLQQLMKAAGWDNLSKEELIKEVNKQLEMMVKQGEVDQLVGEDGEFYYRPIKGGRET